MQITTRHLALLAGSLFAVTAAIDIPHDQAQPFVSTLDYVLEAVFALSLAAAALTLGLLARASSTLSSRIGFGLACVGTSSVAFAAGATHVNGRDMFGPAFALGLLGIGLGYLLLAVADLRRKVAPRFAGLVLLAGLVGMVVLGEGYGVIAWSAGWFAVAALLSPAPVQVRRQEVIAA